MTSTNQAGGHPPDRPRAPPSGIKLTTADAALIKGMLARGDRQSDIAAYFRGVNIGRISEIATEQKFSHVSAAPLEDLPPPGPYSPVQRPHN
jgi:hypothetical protein